MTLDQILGICLLVFFAILCVGLFIIYLIQHKCKHE